MSDKFYCSPEAALKVLLERQRLGAREKVEKWWEGQGKEMPALPVVENAAVLARQLATCRFEDMLFREMAIANGLAPTWWEYTEDIFVSISPLKRSLLRPKMLVRRTANGMQVRTNKLANPQQWERKPLREIETTGGKPLLEWHYEHRERVLGPSIRADVPAYSYPLFLSLFVAHAVLFEDYHGGESGEELDGFTASRFEPAWQQVADEIGLAPLIVRLPWWPELAYYPSSPDDWYLSGIVELRGAS